jgi:hypothetical protein
MFRRGAHHLLHGRQDGPILFEDEELLRRPPEAAVVPSFARGVPSITPRYGGNIQRPVRCVGDPDRAEHGDVTGVDGGEAR